MRDYGYQPDKTTYNSLMVACSKKGDLQTARNLIRSMMQSAEAYPSLAPDELTFTNLFWTYSTYKEPMNYTSKSQQEKISKIKQLSKNDKNDSLELDQSDQKALLEENKVVEENKIADMETPIRTEITRSENAVSENRDLMITGSNTYPLLNDIPVTFSQTIKEAEMIFNYIITLRSNIKLSSKLVNSYLNILVKKSNYNDAFEFYKNFIPKHDIKLNGWIFLSELTMCYKHKKVDESWSIWYDWENWRKEQSKEIEKIYVGEYDRKDDAFKEIGITEKMEYEIYKLMIKILSRCNEISDAIGLLQTLSNSQRPNIQDFTLLLQKCVENDDETSHRKVINLCYNDAKNNHVLQYRNLLAKKWKGIGIKLPPKNKYERGRYYENIQRKKS